jgi:predicted nucleic acid-binding protein
MKKIKIYLDTSVINFLFADDSPEKKEITKQFFELFVSKGIYETFISIYVLEEINNTTDLIKKELLSEVIKSHPVQIIDAVNDEDLIDMLSDEYIKNRVVPENKLFDALHVAVCTVFEIDFLVSWNFKHLANINRERKFITVNQSLNYNYPLRIVTPENLFNDEYESS